MEHPDRPLDDATTLPPEAEARRAEWSRALDASGELTERLEAPPMNQSAASRVAEAESTDRPRPTQPTLPTPESEASALAKCHEDLDNTVLATLEKKFSSDIDGERLAEARAHPTRFEPTAEYQRGLASAYPAEEHREQIVGDLRDNIDPHVDSHGSELPRTVTHERIHQLGNPEFRNQVGRRLDEGTTEHFSRDTIPGVHIQAMPEGYPEEERIAGMIEARVGSELERAYFSGDITGARRDFDAQLGDGALEDVVELIRAGKLSEAEERIKGPR